MKSLCLKKDFLTDVYDIDLLFVMQTFMKVPFKMTEKLPHLPIVLRCNSIG